MDDRIETNFPVTKRLNAGTRDAVPDRKLILASVPGLENRKSIVAVDLFCGIGGLSLGLQNAGIHVAAGNDLDPACARPYEDNLRVPFIERDVMNLGADELRALFGPAAIRVLAACAPCQPFSGYTTKRRATDERWRLLLEVLRLALDVRPEILTVENVPRLRQMTIWRTFVESLEGAGYHVTFDVLDASDYGVPQKRRRLVLIASLLGKIEIPETIEDATCNVRSAIGHLPPVPAGVADGRDPLHVSRSLTQKNLDRLHSSRIGGTWREWPKRLQLKCHKRASGRTYPSVYGRMAWDKPAPTITTQFYGYGNGRFGHPNQDRALTLREGAILQSFPAWFSFKSDDEAVNFNRLGRLIGNAVPPELARVIGTQLKAHAAQYVSEAHHS
ncbi:MAG: DNA cytosine methyltransferase [Candidatus Eremiobacteraeota bacterium]|nr:DNA cytosine methyltransferase [Candidatus Eremiobacteraeota bacterium]